MDDLSLARALHVLAVVIWIGGMAMVTMVVLPAVRCGDLGPNRLQIFEAIERRFSWYCIVGSPSARWGTNNAIRVKRAYEPPSPEDGTRILVDRLWPRGLRKAEAAIDCWLKEIAPSSQLRRWFGHDPSRWEEFRGRYQAELSIRPELLDKLRAQAKQGTLTLVYAARDADHNHAIVLRGVLLKCIGGRPVDSTGQAGFSGTKQEGSTC